MTMLDFIERQRARPEHIRRRLSYVGAAVASGVVALAWVVALANNGLFPTSGALTTKAPPNTLDQAAAAGAALPESGDIAPSQKPALNVVETKTTSTLGAPSASSTAIPF